MESKDLFGQGIDELNCLKLDQEDDITKREETEEDIILEGQLSFFSTGQLRLFGEVS